MATARRRVVGVASSPDQRIGFRPTSPPSLVVGGGDEVGVLLGAPLEGQEVVIAAAPAGEAAAQRWARLVNGAGPLLGVEEPAHPTEDVVLLAPQGILVIPALDRELGLRLPEAQAEVLRQPLHVALGDGDERVGAAVAGALLAIVHRVQPHLAARNDRSSKASTDSLLRAVHRATAVVASTVV